MKHFMLMGSLLFVSLAYAQEPTPAPQLPADASVPAPLVRNHRTKSDINREGKQSQLVGMPFGIGPSLTGTVGVTGGFFLTPDDMVLLEFTSGKRRGNTDFMWSSSSEETVVKSLSLGVHYKKFAGRTFYFRGGADFRHLNYEYSYHPGGVVDTESEFTGTSIALNFQIGNQWQWQNFTMGCDWVGVSQPIYSNVKEDKFVPSSGSPEYDRRKYNEEQDDFVKSANINLLRVYAGASF